MLCSKIEFPNVHVLKTLNAPHCLHDTCYIVRLRKNRQKQLASATHVHTSVNGSGSPQQFGIDSHSLSHGNWSGRSGYDLFCQRTTQNATYEYFAWQRCSVPLWNRQKAASSSQLYLLHFWVLYLRSIKGSHKLKTIRPMGLPPVRQIGLVTYSVCIFLDY